MIRHPGRLSEIVEHGLCIGCGLCQSLAGAERVRMRWVDPPGRLRPAPLEGLDPETERCILATCPGVRLEAPIDPVRHAGARIDPCFGPWIRIWRGHASDPEIHHRGSAGGGLSALGAYLVESGEVDFVAHVRASPERPMRTEAHVSTTRAEVLEGAGSRYGPSAPLVDLLAHLDRARPFALIGKPCDVSAVRNLGCLDPRVAELVRYTLTFSCGTFGDLQCSRWMLERQGVPGGEDNLSLFRYRGHGCPGPTRAVTRDGAVYEESYLDFWYGPHGWTHQFRCKLCADPTGEAADITVTDAWPGGTPSTEEWGGWCLLASRTVAGDALVERAIEAGALSVEPSGIEALYDCQPHQVVKKQGMRARLRAIEEAGALGPCFESLRLEEAAAGRDRTFHERRYAGTRERIERGVNREPLPDPPAAYRGMNREPLPDTGRAERLHSEPMGRARATGPTRSPARGRMGQPDGAVDAGSRRPLEGLRVLDFTRVLAGPFCTALLADLGAEVIKIEPLGGDDYRHVPPFRDGESAFFLLVNRGKRSLTLDLKRPEGLRIARTLAARSDVVVENFKPGVASRLGIDYPTLSGLKPDLIYASVSGFGQQGPLADQPAYDIIIQAASGLMRSTGFEGGPPTLVGEAIGDLAAGIFAAWAVSTALYERERTGRGRHLDVAMFDCLLAMLPTSIAQFAYTGRLPARTGDRHPISVPFGTYRASDDYFVLAILNDGLFRRFLALIGRADLLDDPRLQGDETRSANEPLVRELVESWAGRRSVAEVLAVLAAHDIPAGPIWSIEQSLTSEQVAERGLLPVVEHPALGPIPVLEQPVRFASLARGQAAPPPRLGEHGREILAGCCGLDEAEIGRLEAAGVIGRPQVG